MPSEDVRSALETAIRDLGATLTDETEWLWEYRNRKLDGRTAESLQGEWTQAGRPGDFTVTARRDANMSYIASLLGESGRSAREVKGRFTSRQGKDYARLKSHTASDDAVLQYFEAFEAWLDHAAREGSTRDPIEVGGIDVDDIVRLLHARKNIVLEGVPGTGKTHVVQAIAGRWEAVTGQRLRPFESRSVQVDDDLELDSVPYAPTHQSFATMVMHPSTAYEDFVEGIRPGGHALVAGERFDEVEPLATSGRSVDFAVVAGFFKEICRQAAANPSEDVLVLLDELNRCNVSSVLGDLVLLLEPSKRAVRENGDWSASHVVQLPYSKQTFFVPDNVHVVATTNTTDRSVAPLDAAIRRRFAFVRLEPSFDGCGVELAADGDAAKAVASTIEMLEKLNDRVLRPCLGPDALLGQSYAHALAGRLKRLEKRDEDLTAEQVQYLTTQTWQYDILPQLVDNLRSLGAEDLLDLERHKEWLADRPEIGNVPGAKATEALAQLHTHLQEHGLVVQVTGTGLSRSVRVGHRVDSDQESEPTSTDGE